MFTRGETVGLAEWIIDDTCLVFSRFGKRAPSRFGKRLNELEREEEMLQDLLAAEINHNDYF